MLHDWVAQTLEYNPLIIHKPGKLMAIPDVLSRHFVGYKDNKDEKKDYMTNCFEKIIDLLLDEMSKSRAMSRQKDILEKIEAIDSSPDQIFDLPEVRTLWQKGEELSQGENTIEVNRDTIDRLLVPLPFLARAQRYDKFCSKIINYLYGILPKRWSELRMLQRQAFKYWIDANGILRKIDESAPAETRPPAVLPRALWDDVLKAYHDFLVSGHWKYERLYQAIAASYYFPGMFLYIKGYCHRCLNCAINSKGKTLTSKLNPYIASYPGVTVHLDCTKGPKTLARGNTHLLAIVDNFSGYLRLYPIPQPTAKDAAGALLQYICVNSMPLKIVTDNGPEFANELFTELSNLMGLKQTTISPYNSKSNGQVEWTHKVTKSILQAYVDKFRNDWDLLVPLVEFAFNTSRSSSTTYTPFQVHFG